MGTDQDTNTATELGVIGMEHVGDGTSNANIIFKTWNGADTVGRGGGAGGRGVGGGDCGHGLVSCVFVGTILTPPAPTHAALVRADRLPG